MLTLPANQKAGSAQGPRRKAATGKDARCVRRKQSALRSERKTQGPPREPTADAEAPGSKAAAVRYHLARY